jgi:polyhydroxyalkanoate synthase
VFALIDEARRQRGLALDAAGFGPLEAPYRILAEEPGARLRAYHEADEKGPALLIVPAPIKRGYIWDLLPEVSVVRHALRCGARVYLLEWLTPGAAEDALGLADYADRLLQTAIEGVEADADGAPVLAGHSLGGTLATIFATLHPERVRGLVLVDAPLAFGEEGDRLAKAVAAAAHARVMRRMAGSPVPGSFLNTLSASAVPDVFIGQRWDDLRASFADTEALAIHSRVERWTLDEFPMPGQLFEDILEGLYREDRFRRGTLDVGGQRTGLNRLRTPVLAVVNPLGGVVPPSSITAGLAAAPDAPATVLEYEGDRGPMLQHVGPLVARLAHEHLWPRIFDWMAQQQAHGGGRSGAAGF